MAIETTVISVLQETFPGIPVRNLHAEQLNDLQPTDVPLIIVARGSAAFGEFDTLCGSRADVAEVFLLVDYMGLTLESARTLADAGRQALVTKAGASIESEIDQWEAAVRVYRVSQSYTVHDHNAFLEVS